MVFPTSLSNLRSVAANALEGKVVPNELQRQRTCGPSVPSSSMQKQRTCGPSAPSNSISMERSGGDWKRTERWRTEGEDRRTLTYVCDTKDRDVYHHDPRDRIPAPAGTGGTGEGEEGWGVWCLCLLVRSYIRRYVVTCQ